MNEIIASISTAPGVGAINIVRLSGTGSIKLVNNIFKNKDLTKVETNTINYGHIIYNDEIIDEVLVSIFKAPKTFTREEMVEINTHGGYAASTKVLDILIKEGARLADPGEFTKRAYLNGRIDLIEAESVIDLINSETEKGRKLAISGITKVVSNKIDSIRDDVIGVLANLEVNIDYPEYDDILVLTENIVKPNLLKIKEDLQNLIKHSMNSKIIKSGIDVAIVGSPNVGKSSILNFLTEDDKAIVTNIPGTTRDVVEAKLILEGIVLNLYDTAGIRETTDVVEQIGVEKSKGVLSTADLIIYVIDKTAKNIQEEINKIKEIDNKNLIVLINKDDIEVNVEESLFENINFIYGNTINEDGLDLLKEEIINLYNLSDDLSIDLAMLTNQRQINYAKESLQNIKNAINALEYEYLDMIAIDLKSAYENLGNITGKSYKDDLLDELFSKFCLGK